MSVAHIHDQPRPTNTARSSFHVLSGVIGLLLAEYAPWWLVMAVPITLASTFWLLEATRRMSEAWNDTLMRFFAPIAHAHERELVNSSTWYATALSLLSLTGSPLAFGAGAIVLGLGDPAAALVGRKYGRVALVNNRTLEGTLTFVVVAFLAVLGVVLLWHDELSTMRMLAVCTAASGAGALTELLSRRIDDNFSIPVVTGAVVWAVLAI
jgi:dolichol kinase